MPTRSGSGSASSSLEKPTRSRTGTSESGKNDPPRVDNPGTRGMRNAARQTSSVGAQARSVNPGRGPGRNRPKVTLLGAEVNPRGTGRMARSFAAVGRPDGRSRHTDEATGSIDRRSLRSPRPPSRSARAMSATALPEGDRLLAGGDPRTPRPVRTWKNSSIRRAVVTQERGLRDVQRPGQPLERLDRRRDVPVLVAAQPCLRDPGDLLQVRLRVPGLDPCRAESLSERAFVGHALPPIEDVARRESIPMRNPTAMQPSEPGDGAAARNLAMIPDSAVRPTRSRPATAGALELLLGLVGRFLGDLLQDRLRGGVHQILGFLEAEARQAAPP